MIGRIGVENLRDMLPDLESGMRPKMEACVRAIDGGFSTAKALRNGYDSQNLDENRNTLLAPGLFATRCAAAFFSIQKRRTALLSGTSFSISYSFLFSLFLLMRTCRSHGRV